MRISIFFYIRMIAHVTEGKIENLHFRKHNFTNFTKSSKVYNSLRLNLIKIAILKLPLNCSIYSAIILCLNIMRKNLIKANSMRRKDGVVD